MRSASLWLLLTVGLALQPATATAQGVLGKRAIVFTTADSTNLRMSVTDTLAFQAGAATSEGEIYVFVDPRLRSRFPLRLFR